MSAMPWIYLKSAWCWIAADASQPKKPSITLSSILQLVTRPVPNPIDIYCIVLVFIVHFAPLPHTLNYIIYKKVECFLAYIQASPFFVSLIRSPIVVFCLCHATISFLVSMPNTEYNNGTFLHDHCQANHANGSRE